MSYCFINSSTFVLLGSFLYCLANSVTSDLENLSIVSSTPFSATSLTLSFNVSLTTTPSLAALTWALVNLPLLMDLL